MYKNNKYNKYNNSDNHKSRGDRAVDKFAEMMIARMEQMKSGDWKKGWINGSGMNGMPQNISGRTYNGSNSFFLQLASAKHGYKTPVFMTFNQIKNEGAHVLKGEESMPVIYWNFTIKDKETGKKIDRSEYNSLSKEEKDKYDVKPFLTAYLVFNIDQTNLEEANKEKYDKIVAKFQPKELKDTKGMYANAALDRLFQEQEWVCPIQVNQRSNDAYYSPSRDMIVIPMKEQFKVGTTPEEIYKDGMEYYSTAIHEMAHSTGTPERLNRTKGDKFGEEKYAKEELVAELTAASVGYSMGFDRRILDNNAAYLDSWIATLKENPKFIVSVMADVNKAADMIFEAVDKQRLALGEKPIRGKSLEQDEETTVQDKTEQVTQTSQPDKTQSASATQNTNQKPSPQADAPLRPIDDQKASPQATVATLQSPNSQQSNDQNASQQATVIPQQSEKPAQATMGTTGPIDEKIGDAVLLQFQLAEKMQQKGIDYLKLDNIAVHIDDPFKKYDKIVSIKGVQLENDKDFGPTILLVDNKRNTYESDMMVVEDQPRFMQLALDALNRTYSQTASKDQAVVAEPSVAPQQQPKQNIEANVRYNQDNWYLSAKINGVSYPPRIISQQDARDFKKGTLSKEDLVQKTFGSPSLQQEEKRTRSRSR